MDKEKEIEEMAEVLAKYWCGCYEDCKARNDLTCSNDHCEDCAGRSLRPIAMDLQKAGYGNIEQAVREFAEELKLFCYREFEELIPSIIADKIDNLIKEWFGDYSCETCPDNNNAEWTESTCPNKYVCKRK